MSATTDDIQVDLDAVDPNAVKIDDKKPPELEKDAKTDDVQVVKTETADSTIVKPEDGIEKLKNQLAEEKREREAAQQRAADAEQRAQDASNAEVKARTDSRENQLHLVTNAITQLTQSNDLLENSYAEALSAQDFKAAAKLQREMSTNAARLIQLENGKNALEKAPKITPRPISDPVEKFIADANMTPRSAAWVRAHPDYVRDPNKNRKMVAAHELAVADGINPDTDEYFAAVEDTLKLSKPVITNGSGEHKDEEVVLSDAAAPTQRRTPAAAPVSRAGNGTGSTSNRVTLTPEQVEMAKMMFPDSKNPEQEYAKNLVVLRKEGKLN